MEVFYEAMLAAPIPYTAQMLRFIGVDFDAGLLSRIVESQAFEKQKSIGGTPFTSTGEYAKVKGMEVEPTGFFRSGQSDSWKRDLTLAQKLIVWWRTRELLAECGYGFNGNAKFTSLRSLGSGGCGGGGGGVNGSAKASTDPSRPARVNGSPAPNV
jgi:hypothetical protein